MVQLGDLTVGIVAGLIAAGVFVIQFIVPTVLTLIMVGVLKKEDTAATWSVIGRTLHSSHWPSILRTDSAGVQGVRGRVRILAKFEMLFLLLISAASIVTPLGLYEAIVAQQDLQEEPFSYAQDNSSLGAGTLPRRNDLGLSRFCVQERAMACPWSNNTITETFNSSGYFVDFGPDGYDTRIPANITEIYSAGLSKLSKTVSSVFDIQWRTYKKIVQDPLLRKDQQIIVGDYRQLSQMVLDNAWEVITGLLVNTKTGGIGFRNHTTPPPLKYGSTWSEDLLFVEPETECVDMNITLDFNIPLENNGIELTNLTLTDHGGFANLNLDIPSFELNKSWENPNLRDRAYVAAWFTNAYTMFYLNISNPKDKNDPTFKYLESTVGANFPLKNATRMDPIRLRNDMMMIKNVFGEHLQIPTSTNRTVSNSTLYSNPFKISNENFTDIWRACSSANEKREFRANISNVAINCGMMYGASRRRDGSDSILFDPGTEWTIPLYACASASKASIKTVSFRYNGTDGLQSLKIDDIKPKEYAKVEDQPLWAVERLGMSLHYGNPVWGITLPEHDGHPNISTARQPHLYLPGMADYNAIHPVRSHQGFAGVDFYSAAMGVTYQIDGGGYTAESASFVLPDYTGRSNLAMYRKWQELSRTTTGAASVINLIWTDISANAVVGTKSQLPAEPLQNLVKRDEPATTIQVPITVYTRRIRFKLLYGIPAFLVLALVALVTCIAFILLLMGRATPGVMRRYLDQTSAGRIFTTFLYSKDCPPGAPRSNWVRLVGKKRVDIAGQYPNGSDAVSGVALTSGQTAPSMPGPGGGNIAYGKLDDGAISMHSLPSPQPYSPVQGGAAQSYYNGDAQNTNGPYTSVPQAPGNLHP